MVEGVQGINMRVCGEDLRPAGFVAILQNTFLQVGIECSVQDGRLVVQVVV